MGSLRLAWAHLSFYRGRSLILVLCIAMTFALPIAVHWLLTSYESTVGRRARATPLVLGAKGSRYDLVLSGLYYRGRVPSPLPMRESDRVAGSGLARPIPMLTRHRAAGFPVVGTTTDYYAFRGLRPRVGTLPLMLGDCVLGHGVARATGIAAGGKLLSEPKTVYDISSAYPLRMRVAGVLAESGTADDRAVFVDLKTAWLLDGIGHGHDAADGQAESGVLRRSPDGVVLNESVRKWTEVTPENIDTFHFHMPRAERPVTSVLVVPNDAKSSTLLKGRYRISKEAQLLVPSAVVAEIFAFVLRIKAFFDAQVALVTVVTALFLVLVVLLSLRVRAREMQTLHRIGCGRATVVRLVGTELGILIAMGLVVAVAMAAIALVVLRDFAGLG